MAINVDNAMDIISNIKPTLKFEIIPIEEANNRICAQNIYATSSLPKFDNSAMDGYAIIYEDKNNELENNELYAHGSNALLLFVSGKFFVGRVGVPGLCFDLYQNTDNLNVFGRDSVSNCSYIKHTGLVRMKNIMV